MSSFLIFAILTGMDYCLPGFYHALIMIWKRFIEIRDLDFQLVELNLKTMINPSFVHSFIQLGSNLMMGF